MVAAVDDLGSQDFTFHAVGSYTAAPSSEDSPFADQFSIAMTDSQTYSNYAYHTGTSKADLAVLGPMGLGTASSDSTDRQYADVSGSAWAETSSWGDWSQSSSSGTTSNETKVGTFSARDTQSSNYTYVAVSTYTTTDSMALLGGYADANSSVVTGTVRDFEDRTINESHTLYASADATGQFSQGTSSTYGSTAGFSYSENATKNSREQQAAESTYIDAHARGIAQPFAAGDTRTSRRWWCSARYGSARSACVAARNHY